jgi:peptidoglycan-associated lipoprotein
MRNRFWIFLALLLVVPGLLMAVGCQKKTVMEQTGEAPAPAPAPKEEPVAVKPGPDKMSAMVMQEDIYFAFDRYNLSPMAQENLRRKAEWLRANPDATVTIEGHCDERGTAEYNLALGDRRAESAKAFLVDLGISAKRLATISYGEERPVDPRSNEEAWAKNRRGHFVVN